MGLKLELRPLSVKQANAGIKAWHRHHKAVKAARLAIGAYRLGELVGIATVENPTAPGLQNGLTWEITRVATPGLDACEGARGAQSALSRACWLAASAQGVRRMVTYTRVDELGVGYRAAGFVAVAMVKGRKHDTGNRTARWLPGVDQPTTETIDRVRWEIGPDCATTRVRHRDGKWEVVDAA